MSDHTPTSEAVIEHPEHIPGYTYGTDEAATSPLSLQDLARPAPRPAVHAALLRPPRRHAQPGVRRRPRRPGIGADALPHKSDLQGTTSELWATGGCLAGCLWH
jgi:hypothetical protein